VWKGSPARTTVVAVAITLLVAHSLHATATCRKACCVELRSESCHGTSSQTSGSLLPYASCRRLPAADTPVPRALDLPIACFDSAVSLAVLPALATDGRQQVCGVLEQPPGRHIPIYLMTNSLLL